MLCDLRGRRGGGSGPLIRPDQPAQRHLLVGVQDDEGQIVGQFWRFGLPFADYAAAGLIGGFLGGQYRAGVHLDADGEQLGRQMAQLRQHAPPPVVGRDRQMRTITQSVAHKGGQGGIGPALHENPAAIGIKPVDRVGKAHAAGVLRHRRALESVAGAGEGGGRGAGIERHTGFRQLGPFEQLAKCLGHGGHIFSVIAPGDWQLRTDSPLFDRRLLQRLDVGFLAKDDGLIGAIVHGEMHRRKARQQRLQDRAVQGGHVQKRACWYRSRGFDLGEDLVHLNDHPPDLRAVHRQTATGHQCSVFTRRMAQHCIGFQPHC